MVEKKVEIVEKEAHGKIATSLWKTMESNGFDPGVIDLMEEALSSSVDFHHTQKGDEFKLIYEGKYIDGEYIGAGKLIAAMYKNDQENFIPSCTKRKKKRDILMLRVDLVKKHF
ncbi:MAG: hypothetical protein IPL63_19545 [Saprospiraceae bacterium]|nr:hypothetical protein [Saprospiraceae bacterium]